MRRETSAYLWDALQAARAAGQFIEGVEYQEFVGDLMRRSAVERQIEVLGEALNRIRRADPDVSSAIEDADRIIGMRNIIVHEYGSIDYLLVWQSVTMRVPALAALLASLLEEHGQDSTP
ncbi:hypothetical protein MANAM107_03810 [Actinomyces capricornis]|uniref:DUF86 domain-containing protein n=2 Tax=Actinomyces capricornis TaxID=2755559 RepID=A0ABM7U7P4_9ACTO|nr:hypothetical protein MANAM107_03810 [Actinomyces capricornis]